jgi:uncharacterized protein GlcG (DUF336 family)
MAGKVVEIAARSSVSLEGAREIIRAGQEKARQIKVPMNIAVVDAGPNLVAFERMEGAWIGSITGN